MELWLNSSSITLEPGLALRRSRLTGGPPRHCESGEKIKGYGEGCGSMDPPVTLSGPQQLEKLEVARILEKSAHPCSGTSL
ncbi:hypothetical protein TNCV_5030841 [Trichonephila clavipes]|nr:hypothetical protein TNCV_5030841 [Trichonephila clavipes]